MVFTVEATVRFSDTDAMGHVNNAVFLTYLEEARLALLESLLPDLLAGRGLVVARVECDYVRPITVPAGPVTVATWVDHVGRSSFTLASTIEQAGQVVSRARNVIVAYDYAAAASRPLSDADRAGLQQAMADAPDEVNRVRDPALRA